MVIGVAPRGSLHQATWHREADAVADFLATSMEKSGWKEAD